MRPVLVDDGNRFEMVHEPRQVLQLPPEPIDLCLGTIHRDGALDLDALPPSDTGHRAGPIALRRVAPESPVDRAAAAYCSRYQVAPDWEQYPPEPLAPEREDDDCRSGNAGYQPFGAADVDSVSRGPATPQVVPALVRGDSVVGRCHGWCPYSGDEPADVVARSLCRVATWLY